MKQGHLSQSKNIIYFFTSSQNLEATDIDLAEMKSLFARLELVRSVSMPLVAELCSFFFIVKLSNT